MLQYVALATCGHWGGVVVSGSLWSLPLGPRAQSRSPSWKGTGVAEVVKGELPAEAYRWPFPCPGLPHHRRLPDPAESQGAARLKVACLQEPRFGREATDPRAPASRTCRSLWGSSPRGSCRTGPLPPPRPFPLCHAPSWPPSSGSFSTLQPWDPLPRLPSKAGTPEGIFWGWGRLGALGAGRGPSGRALPLPSPAPAPVGRRHLADESETTSGVGA